MPEVSLSEYQVERQKPLPSFNHGLLQASLARELGVNYKGKYHILSELSLQLDDWLSVPDLCIYPKKPLDLRNDQTKTLEPPLCAIEISSPTQPLGKLTIKAGQYFDHGVRSVWVVFLELGNVYVFSGKDTYEIYRPEETLKDEVLDIELPLVEVFE
ncbi:MAG: Uma2 family endonuclease [Phaeodactylibacter xiamenensis]|uniref:Uma2 family endonuclease n=1 Tax=Phaeodactylibacter xiamenensis TaxID=1524460 RepID=UPI0006976B75|nr:Uma2 family endonuclease [Phaeodactylibacter xiamenensis]MCR9050567.1 Uma2 family endonuclease [bacterium]